MRPQLSNLVPRALVCAFTVGQAVFVASFAPPTFFNWSQILLVNFGIQGFLLSLVDKRINPLKVDSVVALLFSPASNFIFGVYDPKSRSEIVES